MRGVLLSSLLHLRLRNVPNIIQAAAAYNAEQITVLEGLEPVRKRPGMYIGSTGSRGLHHLVFEVVDNSVDEALAGHATLVNVSLNQDNSVTVTDNGRGIPCDLHSKTGKPALETVLTVLHAGGKFGAKDSGYKVSGGLHGVGVSVVNALSDQLHVGVRRDGKLHEMSFRRGQVVAPMTSENLPPATGKNTGTAITFRPDSQIFKEEGALAFDFGILARRFDEQAYLNAGLRIELHESATGNSKTFHHEGGIAEYIAFVCEGKKALFDGDDGGTIRAVGERNDVSVDVALRWSSDMFTDSLIGFANSVQTPNGGTHVDGLKFAVGRTINSVARSSGKLREKAPNVPGEFLREGLTAIVSVKLGEAEFEGQTKSRLGNPEVRGIVSEIVSEALSEFLQRRPKVLALILDKALAAQAAADAARAARELVRRKSVLGSSMLPGKLADCSSRDPRVSEIFIVEGDSAGGSAKQGRSRETQAILPLRGKILNIEKADDTTMYQNTEMQALITCLGLGIKGEPFDASQLRYHRIILMTDADVDGAHIRTLLLTFLYRYQRQVVEGGYVYIASPPLYKVRHRSKSHYCYSDDELHKLLSTLGGRSTTQRFKGLGEMMPAELRSTTMDASTRTLKRVTVDDAAEADRIFSILMGSNISPRKQFIRDHAGSLDWTSLDV